MGHPVQTMGGENGKQEVCEKQDGSWERVNGRRRQFSPFFVAACQSRFRTIFKEVMTSRWLSLLLLTAKCQMGRGFCQILFLYTGISSEIMTKLRDWAVWQARAGCYSQAALSSNDSKTLYILRCQIPRDPRSFSCLLAQRWVERRRGGAAIYSIDVNYKSNAI